MSLPVGVILAGGRATRMGGGDKGLLTLGGRTLMDRVIERIEGQVAGLAINANGDPSRFYDFGLPIISDSVADHPGPLAGVLAGLDWAHKVGASHIVTVAADTPFFPMDLARRLGRAAIKAQTPIALAGTYEGGRTNRHPTFGYWPVHLRDDLRSALAQNVRKVVMWTDSHGAATAAFEDGVFFNINTPEDLAEAEGML
ncbi:MAG: molybdenum cofactor guanylyltransferase MobA [Rhodobacteraceae bacterium]|nr:molybdenum cofactor guanylyltransferase MobA [Paracoccaceae bacterium]